jgi:hypothetical protein
LIADFDLRRGVYLDDLFKLLDGGLRFLFIDGSAYERLCYVDAREQLARIDAVGRKLYGLVRLRLGVYHVAAPEVERPKRYSQLG